MTPGEVRDQLKKYGFRFGGHDQLELHTPEIFHAAGPQPAADELNARLEGTFFLEISILSPQFNDWRAIEDAGFEIVTQMTTMSARLFWIKPKAETL